MIDWLNARGLALLGKSFATVQAVPPEIVDAAAPAIDDQHAQWAAINVEIAGAVGAAAHAAALNHRLAAELDEIAREVALIRQGLERDAA